MIEYLSFVSKLYEHMSHSNEFKLSDECQFCNIRDAADADRMGAPCRSMRADPHGAVNGIPVAASVNT